MSLPGSLARLSLASSLLALAGPAAAADPIAASPPPASVQLTVEAPPEGPWKMTLRNDGTQPARVMADARLLWIEVITAPEPPPAGKPAPKPSFHEKGKIPTCRVPGEMRPDAEVNDRAIVLKPGERYEEKIDPVVLCGAGRLAAGLKPGALIYPHLGWPDAPHRGKKAVLPSPPYIVDSLHEPRDFLPARNLAATPFVLYAPLPQPADKPTDKPADKPTDKPADKPADKPTGKPAPRPDAPVDERAARLVLSTTPRADALAAEDVMVSVTVANRGLRAATLHMRTDDLLFDVRTPQGRVVRCDRGTNRRAAVRDFFETLGPNARRQWELRLREFCPVDTFSQPGVYEATPKLYLSEQGESFRLSALTAMVTGPTPTKIRVRTGRYTYHAGPPKVISPAPEATPASPPDQP